MKTKQIVFTKTNTAELLEEEYSAPQENEVTVRLEYSAVSSGTERANITGDPNTNGAQEGSAAAFPKFLGYSAAGIVTDKGEGVTDIALGDKVVVFWGQHKKDITISKGNVVKIPDGVSAKEAAMTMIASFPLAAIRKTHLETAESAVVMGLGILGVFAVQLCRAAGAMPVIAVDPVKERRDFAISVGADYAFDPTEEDFAEKVKSVTNGGANVAIEVTGVGAGLTEALDCMAKFGRVALLGCTRNSDFSIDYYRKVHFPGITIVGAHTMARPAESYPGYWTQHDDIEALLRLIKGGRVDFGKVISEVHSPEDAPEVYTRLVNEKNFPVGVLFDWIR